ncbi:MAG: ABC transporter permease subunit [Elusimicrobia bacterium]|nr:ABC transporter permease subunit [Elusimicrobiota bacterium]
MTSTEKPGALSSLYLKETRAYFNTPAAYIVSVAFLLITGYLTVQPLFLANQANINGLMDLAPLLFTFFVPAVTMRLLSEEQKAGTIELLQAFPIEDHQIVAAKYLAAVTLLWSLLALTLGLPVAVGLLGKLDWGAVAVGYLGLALATAMLAAIGLFASSLTRNQVVAFILGFALAFALFILGKMEPFVPPWLSPLSSFVGLDSHIQNMGRGVLDTRDLLYFGTFSGVFLFLTWLRLWSSRSE